MITRKKYFLRLRWYQSKNWIKLNWGKLVGTNPYKLKPGGFCPVQIEGFTKEGQWFYFRARGNSISFEIYNNEEEFSIEKPLFERRIEYGTGPFDAGWMQHEDAIRLTTVWLNEWYGKTGTLNFNFKKNYFL